MSTGDRICPKCGRYLSTSYSPTTGEHQCIIAGNYTDRWGKQADNHPACKRCGDEEFRFDGYCSTYCRDMAEVEAERDQLRVENSQYYKAILNHLQEDKDGQQPLVEVKAELQQLKDIVHAEIVAANQDADRLAQTLAKFRVVISGYGRASESHLPEVDAALAAHNARKEGENV
jgi:hypothetical protein